MSEFLTDHGVVIALVCAAAAVVYGALTSRSLLALSPGSERMRDEDVERVHRIAAGHALDRLDCDRLDRGLDPNIGKPRGGVSRRKDRADMAAGILQRGERAVPTIDHASSGWRRATVSAFGFRAQVRLLPMPIHDRLLTH